MRKLSLLCMLLLSLDGYCMTFKQADRVFNILRIKTGAYIPLHYSSSSEVNAYSTGYDVVITKGMLRLMRDDGQVAMVLGHELAHYINNDEEVDENSYTAFYELRADRQGWLLCTSTGWKNCISAYYILRKALGNQSGDDVHPNWDVRIKYALTGHK